MRSASIRVFWRVLKARGLRDAAKIMKPFCACTDQQFDDWMNDRALPSVVRKMQEAHVPPRQSARIDKEMEWVKQADLRLPPAQARIDLLTRELSSRLTKTLNAQKPDFSHEYQFDLAGKKFVQKDAAEPESSVDTQLRAQIASYLKSHEKEIMAGAQKLTAQDTGLPVDSLRASPSSEDRRSAPRPPPARIGSFSFERASKPF